MIRKAILTLLAIFTVALSTSGQTEQAPDTLPDNVLLEKQWSLGALIHSNGWGIKLRKGRNITALKQFMWEAEFSTYKSSKEIRTINPYSPIPGLISTESSTTPGFSGAGSASNAS